MSDAIPEQERGQPAAPPVDPAGHATPTPVRVSLGGDAAHSPEDGSGAEPAAPEVILESEGRAWAVRVRGRSRGGPSAAPVPLLLLGFFADPADEAPRREALVVARSLEELSPARLEAAFRASLEPGADDVRKPLFPEIASKGSKRDG